MKEIGIYIHIPFCKSKCLYCDFCSFPQKEDRQKEYVNAVIKEIEKCNIDKSSCIVKTIYFGGGTPSFIEACYIKKILNAVRAKFNIHPSSEITIEVNPGTADNNKINTYFEIGINRLSIGLQSTRNQLLKTIGRIHCFDEFKNTYDMARKIGFKNMNVDLMIGLPNQSVDDVEDSVNEIINLNPEHISVYSLIIEENTKMKELIDSGKLTLPAEDVERQMYWTVKKELEKNGYCHYEISNFAKPGYESKHNTDCWNQHEYIGFGLSAHSYFNGVRYSNICDLNSYIDNIELDQIEKNVIVHEVQNAESMMNEYVILKLRMIEGLNVEDFYQLFNTDFTKKYENEINKLMKNNLITIENNQVKLTDRGIDFANIVWEEFV